MKGVVTGAAGFLGSHVADVLAEAGHEVTVVDLAESLRYPTVVCDIRDGGQLERAFEGADFVCHLAAIGDVYLAGSQPQLAADANVGGTASVCEAALKVGIKRVVCASTWEVYGKARYQPMDEAHPCDPDHPYNITKLAGERLARSYAHLRGLNVIALRLGTSFGTRMRPNSVFSLFIRRALDGEPLTIQGSGGQGRQFTHARDIGRAFGAALTRGRSGEAYNIVARRLVTISELAQIVTQLVPGRIVYTDARPGDAPSAAVSSQKAADELGWLDSEDLESSLLAMVEEARRARGH